MRELAGTIKHLEASGYTEWTNNQWKQGYTFRIEFDDVEQYQYFNSKIKLVSATYKIKKEDYKKDHVIFRNCFCSEIEFNNFDDDYVALMACDEIITNNEETILIKKFSAPIGVRPHSTYVFEDGEERYYLHNDNNGAFSVDVITDKKIDKKKARKYWEKLVEAGWTQAQNKNNIHN